MIDFDFRAPDKWEADESGAFSSVKRAGCYVYIYSYMQMITHLWLVHSPTLLLPGFCLGLHSLPLLLVLLLLLPSSHVMEEEAGEGEQRRTPCHGPFEGTWFNFTPG